MTAGAVFLALAVGLSLGLLGGGGSILTIPIFRYALGFGVKESIAMSLGVVSLVSAVGMLRHWRSGNVNFRALAAFAPAAILATFGGAKLAHYVPEPMQMVGLGMVMGVAAMLMWGGPMKVAPPVGGATRGPRGIGHIVAAGIALGFLTGVMGVGGGFLIVPALVLLLGLEMKTAVGTSLGVIALNAASGFAGYLGQVTMNWTLMFGFSAVAALGVFVGAAVVPHLSQQQLRRGFSIFLILIATYILYRR
jgi:hypothetical protein